jgi:hypothetical protein
MAVMWGDPQDDEPLEVPITIATRLKDICPTINHVGFRGKAEWHYPGPADGWLPVTQVFPVNS